MRMPSKQPQQLTKDEESIINSFYEERKARSNNHKYHNLLKKNISFFQPEKTQEDSIAISPVYAAPKNNETVKLQERRMSQPPLPPTAPKASANA